MIEHICENSRAFLRKLRNIAAIFAKSLHEKCLAGLLLPS